MDRAARLAAVAMVVALSACVVVPQTRQVYDPECRILTREVTLEAAVIGGFQACAGEGCLAMLAALGVITAASAVVSGSVALVGNVVYWFERQGQCRRQAPTPVANPAPAPAARAASASGL